jgi:group I intron endonuclease
VESKYQVIYNGQKKNLQEFKNQSGIYKFVFPNNNIYIGSTVDIPKRLRTHFAKLRKNTHENDRMNKVYRKYGMPAIEILEIVEEKDLICREQYYIDTYGFNNLINISNIAGKMVPEGTRIYKVSRDDSTIIQEFISISEAARHENVSNQTIHIACNKTNNISYNHRWISVDKYEELKPLLEIPVKENKIEILKISKDDETILDSYPSISQAALINNVNDESIRRAYNKENTTAGEFRWCTKDKYEELKEHYKIPRTKYGKPIVVYTLEKELIQIFPSIIAASKHFKINNPQAIRDCLKGKRKFYYNMIWEYA